MSWVKLKDSDADISHWFECVASWQFGHLEAVLEQVHSMPKQGVASMFKFGQSYGFLRGMLAAHKIRFREATPGKWQGRILGFTKKKKQFTETQWRNYKKSKAQELFPKVEVTHAIADALLIADYTRRITKE